MTKNTKLYLIGLVLIATISATTMVGVGMLASAPNKPAPKIYEIDATSSGKSITMKTGESIRLTLKDFGDGGYSWVIKDQDVRLLKLASASHSNASSALGDFGNNIWIFTAITPGSMTLNLTCARPWNTTDVCATFSINVVIQ
jgi:predicted secreted protein